MIRLWIAVPAALALAFGGLALGTGTFFGVAQAENAGHALPPPAVDATPSGSGSETAVFSGGCFWGVQGVFQHVKGSRRRFPAIPAATSPIRITSRSVRTTPAMPSPFG